MSPEKLEALRKLAVDERTPVEEARNAALAFVRGGGVVKAGDDVKLAKLEAERDDARDEAAKHKAEAERLRFILDKMLALRDAEERLEKNKADVEREARQAIGRKAAEPERKAPDVRWQNPFQNPAWWEPVVGTYPGPGRHK